MQITQITELNQITQNIEVDNPSTNFKTDNEPSPSTNSEADNQQPQNVSPHQLILKVSISPEDYAEQVKKELKKMAKNADIKGFRPGHVPIEYIKKRFAKEVTNQVLTEILNDSTAEYCKENNKNAIIDLSYYNHGDFEKKYNLDTNETFDLVWYALLKFELNFDLDFESPAFESPNYIVQVTEDDLNEQIKLIQRHFGIPKYVDYIEGNSIINIKLEELNTPDTLEPIVSETILMPDILNEQLEKSVIQLKVGDSIEINIFEDLRTQKSKQDIIKNLLHNPENRTPEDISPNFKMTILKSRSVVPSPLDQALFDNVAPNINNEEQLREHLKHELEIDANNVVQHLKTQRVRKILFDAVPEFRYPFEQFLTLAYLNPANEKAKDKKIYESAYQHSLFAHEQQFVGYLLEKYNIEVQYESVFQAALVELYQTYSKRGKQIEMTKLYQETEKLLEENKRFNMQCTAKAATKNVFDFLTEKLKLTDQYLNYTEFKNQLPQIESEVFIKLNK